PGNGPTPRPGSSSGKDDSSRDRTEVVVPPPPPPRPEEPKQKPLAAGCDEGYGRNAMQFYWSGVLPPEVVLEIHGLQANIPGLRVGLPQFPGRVTLLSGDVEILQQPSKANNCVLRLRNKGNLEQHLAFKWEKSDK